VGRGEAPSKTDWQSLGESREEKIRQESTSGQKGKKKGKRRGTKLWEFERV